MLTKRLQNISTGKIDIDYKMSFSGSKKPKMI